MSSRTLELLISLTRGGPRTLGAQIESQIRDAIRIGRLRPGSPMPSTRDLAQQLGVSRPLVVGAYAQLAAEGYLTLRQGARPRVSHSAFRRQTAPARKDASEPGLKFDFRTGVPDLSSFPHSRWLRAQRVALANMLPDDFGYRDKHGSEVLRSALADYLGRVRGVVADASQIIVTSGFAQGRVLACRALSALGAKRIAVEDPGYTELEPIRRCGLEIVPVAVDQFGLRVDDLERTKADIVMVTPAHQYPTGRVMSVERRMQLRDWLYRSSAVAIEDDYDSEFRYDGAPVGALQGLAPDYVVYAGTASKMLAPALRLGWLVVPDRLLATVHSEQLLLDLGCPRIEQHTLAEFISSGEFDRHLRRMRTRYRARRDALTAALTRELPEAGLDGIAAGLHATIRLPPGHDEQAIRAELQRCGVAIDWLSEHCIARRIDPPTLLLSYARTPESTLEEGVRVLAGAIRAAQTQSKPSTRTRQRSVQ